MIYYFIRITIFIIIVLFTALIWKKNIIHIKAKNKKIISLFLLIVLIIFAFYPYEGYFIRFKTKESSINYSIPYINSCNNYYIQDNNTVFFISNKGNNYYYHSIALYNNTYGLCDFNTNIKLNIAKYLDCGKVKGLFSVSTVYNQITNKTCYFINFTKAVNTTIDNDFNIYDTNDSICNQIKELQNDSIKIFYKVADGQPDQNFAIKINNKIYSIM